MNDSNVSSRNKTRTLFTTVLDESRGQTVITRDYAFAFRQILQMVWSPVTPEEKQTFQVIT